jgi:hypothetical protein
MIILSIVCIEWAKRVSAFWLGWDTGGSLPAAVPNVIVAGRHGVQAGSLLGSRLGTVGVINHRTTDICSCDICWCRSGLAWT